MLVSAPATKPMLLRHQRVDLCGPTTRLLDLFRIDVPIVQAPMAGVRDVDIMIGAAQGILLALLPCAMISENREAGG